MQARCSRYASPKNTDFSTSLRIQVFWSVNFGQNSIRICNLIKITRGERLNTYSWDISFVIRIPPDPTPGSFFFRPLFFGTGLEVISHCALPKTCKGFS